MPEKNVRKAQILSSFLPGLGEIYAGEPISGVFTLALNLVFGGLTVKSFVENRPLDGVLISLFLWSRFYQGGIEIAGRSAHRFNEEEKQTFIRGIQNKYGFEL